MGRRRQMEGRKTIYVLGVFCGVMAVTHRDDIKSEIDDDDIQHVGYTQDQMGYDK